MSIQYHAHVHVHVHVPACDSGCCSEEEHTAVLADPGESGEAAVTVELSPAEDVEVRDTSWHYHLARVAGAQVWV